MIFSPTLNLQILSRHLYGPDFDTVHNSKSINLKRNESQVRNDIEYNYQNMSARKKLRNYKAILLQLAHAV